MPGEYRILRSILTSLLIAVLAFSGYGQSRSAYIKEADKSYEDKNYSAALTYYNAALEFDSTDTDILYKAAESARQFNAYVLAEKNYKLVYDRETEGEYPEVSFWLGSMNQFLGNYDTAATYYQVYLSEREGENTLLDSVAMMQIEACNIASELVQSPFEQVTIEKLGTNINTEYNEFGALAMDSSLYFSSMRYIKEKDSHYPKRNISHIMRSDSNAQAAGTDLPGDINDFIKMSAHTTFNKDTSRMYYTVCDYIDVAEIECDIYYREIDSEGNLGTAVRLPEFINADSSTNTQPSIGYDQYLLKDILYFVSNRNGGKGGLDVWYSIIDQDQNLSQPMNLEAVNTTGDDISPFYHSPTNTLYYSSDGFRGLGGFDIHKSQQIASGNWRKPTNVGAPVNTSFNDVYFSLSEDSRTGYFSSNRIGSFYIDELNQACCYDIYKADIVPCQIDLLAYLFDFHTREPLFEGTIRIVDLYDSSEQVITNDTGNLFNPAVDCGKEYRIIAEREGYEPDSVNLSTIDSRKNDTIVKKIFLKSKFVDLQVLTYNAKTLQDLFGVTVRLIDLTDLGSTPDIVKFDSLSNSFRFNLRRGHTYRVIGSRPNFTTASLELTVPEDAKPETIVKKLYLEPAGFLRYLPLFLYFDNDHPNPKTRARRTDLMYSQTYNDYYAKKQEFIDEYTGPLDGAEKDQALQKMEQFFEGEVRKGAEDFEEFLELLKTLLEQGNRFEIFLKGYASPRAAPDYNNILGQRRISSVYNEIRQYKDGYFLQYTKDGRLKITERSFGETQAPKNIPDRLDDRRGSIYSVDASLERRVEIIEVKKIINE